MLALALAACGGGDPNAAAIEKIVKELAKDNATLCAHATQHLLALLGGSKAVCESSARGYEANAESGIDGKIEVHVTGDTATADFTALDGSGRHITFVKGEDGEWRIDAVTG